MRITSKGQVTIPAEIRRKAGFRLHTEVDITFDGGGVRIIRHRTRKRSGRGARIIANLRGTSDTPMSTDEIMALTRGD